MLRKAREKNLIASVPVVKLIEETPREQLIKPWMGQRLLAVMENSRAPGKKHAPKSINYGWDPLRTVLMIMLDSGLRPNEVFRMRWENIYWDKSVIFNPRGKSRKSRRLVPLTARVRAALLVRQNGANEGWVFPSKRSASGHIETVQKQWAMAKKLSCLPDSIVLYCARHTFSTDAMEGTGNLMAVMDAMGHSRVDVTRLYQHPGLQQVTAAIERRNQGMVQ
jgi:integrase